MNADGLVVGNTAPALTLASEEFWVEAPRDDSADELHIFAVCVKCSRNSDKASLSAGGIVDSANVRSASHGSWVENEEVRTDLVLLAHCWPVR